MNKTFLTFINFVLINAACFSQINLVQNGGFENYNICPSDGGEIYHAINWWGAGGTPDYFNSCSNSIVNVPNTYLGNQYAKNGNAYTGILVLEGFEYLQTKLISSLNFGKKYSVEFYIIFPKKCTYAIDMIGAYFSQDTSFNTSIFGIPQILKIPQVLNQSGNIIKDTNNWVKINGEFIAQGNEQFITIGNFICFDSTNIDTIDGNMHFAYYFIDDVSVCECEGPIIPPSENSFTVPNAFTPNNDGVNDVFKVKGQNIKTLTSKIINRWGQELYKWNNVNEGWDGKYKGKDVAEGTYFYVVTVGFEDGEARVEKGSVLLSR